MKKCKQCGKLKSKDNFYNDKSNNEGLYIYCKKCSAKNHKEYYLKNRFES